VRKCRSLPSVRSRRFAFLEELVERHGPTTVASSAGSITYCLARYLAVIACAGLSRGLAPAGRAGMQEVGAFLPDGVGLAADDVEAAAVPWPGVQDPDPHPFPGFCGQRVWSYWLA